MCIRDSTAGFPFSPPQPSPLSPKLLPCFDDHVGHSLRDRVKNSEISGDEMAFGQFSNGSSMVGYNPTNNNPNELYHTSGIESRPNVPVASKSGISRKVISRFLIVHTHQMILSVTISSVQVNMLMKQSLRYMIILGYPTHQTHPTPVSYTHLTLPTNREV